MTIILQHQFWGLKVKENHFEVTLSFRKIPATLAIPFGALTAFVDPGVQFGLNFQPEPEARPPRRRGPPLAPAMGSRNRRTRPPRPAKS